MKNLPVESELESEVLEPEIVGLEPPPPSLFKSFLQRGLLMLALVLAGVGLCVVGLVLTFTIVGAVLGLPMLFLGLGLVVFSLLTPLNGRSIKVKVFRRGRP